jgi:hypothetical protein
MTEPTKPIDKTPANVKKMEIALKEMEDLLNTQKIAFQQTEKKFQQFKKFATTFIEQSKKIHEKKPRKPSGFVLPVPASNELCTFLNIPEGSEVSRTEVTKYLIHLKRFSEKILWIFFLFTV